MEKILKSKSGNNFIKVKCWQCNKEAFISKETGVLKGDEDEVSTWIWMYNEKMHKWIYECPDCD